MHDFIPNIAGHKNTQIQAAVSKNAPSLRKGDGAYSDLFNCTKPKCQELELKTNLVSMVCHDLLSPMTSLRHCLELLAQSELPADKQENVLRIAIKSVNKIDSVAKLWLDYDSALHGVHHRSPTPVCMKAAIREAIDNVGLIANERNIQIELESNVGTVTINSMHFDQILSNLLLNAVEYADKHTRVTIKARLKGSVVEVSVANQGPLISEVQKQSMFKKFSRIGSHPNRSRGSLGLFICHWLLTLEGGSIECNDTLQGNGTVFTCTIPFS
jgi:two-component system sensor histidine kinase KdpD